MIKEIPLALYREIHANVPIACVDAVIIHNGKVLLGRRANKPLQGEYYFPGGRVYKGETLEAAIKRKVNEETGLTIEVIRQLKTGELLAEDGPFGGPTHTINVTFLAKVVGDLTLKTDSQHEELSWISVTEDSLLPYIKDYLSSVK